MRRSRLRCEPSEQDGTVKRLIDLGRFLIPRLQETDPDMREAIANVLGAIGTETTLPALQAATKDSNGAVAAAAKRAIARLQAPR